MSTLSRDALQVSASPDDLYEGLTRLEWKGAATQVIKWKREKDNAVATFGNSRDATLFVHGYLRFWEAINKRDTPDSISLRGIVREDMLPMESMDDLIEIPDRHYSRGPVTVKIPLNIMNARGLQNALDYQAGGGGQTLALANRENYVPR